MRKPIGVLIAAAVLGILTAFGLLGALGLAAVAFFIPVPNLSDPRAYHVYRLFMAVFILGDLCYCIFCGFVVAGLFRMRIWARISVVILGALTCVFWGLMSVFMLGFRNWIPSGNPSVGSVSSVVPAFVTVVYGALALVGLWWVVYFNLKHVRIAFKENKNQEQAIDLSVGHRYSFWNGAVIVLACCSLLGGVSMIGMAWLRLPLWLAGAVFRGKPALMVALLVAAFEFFVGIGLLRKLRAAYWSALALEVFAFISICVAFIPRVATQISAIAAETDQRVGVVANTQLLHQGRMLIPVFNVFELALVIFFFYALLRCRNIYDAQPDLPSLDTASN